jgi:hypothetical protein
MTTHVMAGLAPAISLIGALPVEAGCPVTRPG